MDSARIRRSFLGFFAERGHKILPSSSLIPDDPTLLLTAAGMVQFKPYFLGQKKPDFPRAATVQKVARTTDIENVGVTARHLSFFEMLGNFSFGDYYKTDASAWAWELTTEVFGLEPDRLWVTVFETDDEAADIWRDHVGVKADRIVRRGAEDNFWSMGVAGPCGPCSEIFYDRGPAYGEVDGFQDGDRIMEFWNLVFMQNLRDDAGNILGELPNKNIDTGSGLERVAMILQGVASAYDTDVMSQLLAQAGSLTGKTYGRDAQHDVSLRIMADHARAAAFLIGDGVFPSNEDRGYVLRRLIRRAVRHAKILGCENDVMEPLVTSVIQMMGDAYPELDGGKSFILQTAEQEEESFRRTLRQGLTLLEQEVKGSKGSLPGATAFKLHDTYGFPIDLTVEIANEAGLEVDRDEFGRLMDEQRTRARDARTEKADALRSEAFGEILSSQGKTAFLGYDELQADVTVLAIVANGRPSRLAKEGDEVHILLNATPFYAEAGGQVGDSGTIVCDAGAIQVEDTQHAFGDLTVHRGRVTQGEISNGAKVRAAIDPARRRAIARSHSATHVIHRTLRDALGDHARQAGSLVDAGRLRFDFPHTQHVPRDVLQEVEATVNARLLDDSNVHIFETSMTNAKEIGAIALFGEKYGDVVRVVEIGDYSTELCGGTHVEHTAQVGPVKILGEASIGANLRRIEALTGAEAIEGFRRDRGLLDSIASMLGASAAETPARVQQILDDLKTATKEIERSRLAATRSQAGDLAQNAERVGDSGLVVANIDGLRVDMLQKLAVAVRDAVGGPTAVVLASASDGKAGIVAAVSKDLTSRGISAKGLIAKAAKAIGGGAGGKDDVATGGGSNASGVDEALRLAAEDARAALGA